MILCIDSGNSRIKWGLHDGRTWCAVGALGHAELARLGEQLAGLRPSRTMLANVAGASAGVAIRATVSSLGGEIQEVRASAMAGGVRNAYTVPEKLGVDRWCALIGAHRLHAGAAIVVMAGTATTIDTLGADGTFGGGLILPGLDLMRAALFQGTAGLPLASGAYSRQPRCTDDAIVSGCLEATAGAIERAWAALAGDERACCLLSGGNAERLAPLLGVPWQSVDNLVLEGLRVLAEH